MIPRRLRFVVAGGSGLGLGHLARSAVIAQVAREAGAEVDFALRGDAVARSFLERNLPGVVIKPWLEAGAAACEGGWSVFDARAPLDAELRALRQRGSRALVLDRDDLLDRADLSVIPALHAEPCEESRRRAGPSYAVIPPPLRRIVPPPYPRGRDRVLVSFGGADPLGLTERIAPWLHQRLGHQAARVRVACVIGPAFRDPVRLGRRLERLGWEVHRAPSRSRMAALMARALFALVGFGVAVEELAFLGVPSLFVTHHASDHDAARRAESLGVGRFVGFGAALHEEDLDRALDSALDPAWRAQANARGRSLLGDGRGAERILEAVAVRDAELDEAAP